MYIAMYSSKLALHDNAWLRKTSKLISLKLIAYSIIRYAATEFDDYV